MRYLILLCFCGFFPSFATPVCETVIADGTSPYAPTRDRLRMARPPFPDDGGWEFGRNVVGSFFALNVAGRFKSLSVSGLTLRGHAGATVVIIGHIAPDFREVDGPGGYPVFEHALRLNPDVPVRFTRPPGGDWVAEFE